MLKKLALVNIGLCEHTLAQISEYLSEHNVHLKHLDLSYSELYPKDFIPLLDTLTYEEQASDCKLENISLAGNKLFIFDPK